MLFQPILHLPGSREPAVHHCGVRIHPPLLRARLLLLLLLLLQA
jgi:hypothetical protein